jgi:hypothetical protein
VVSTHAGITGGLGGLRTPYRAWEASGHLIEVESTHAGITGSVGAVWISRPSGIHARGDNGEKAEIAYGVLPWNPRTRG